MNASVVNMPSMENTKISRTSGDGMEEEKVPQKVEQKQQLTTRAQRPQRKQSTSNHEKLFERQNCGTGTAGGGSTMLPLPGLHTLYRRPEIVSRSIAPALPKGELIQLKPRLVSTGASLPEHKKTKEPKFVPYEPYPGAVNPMETTPKNTSPHIKKVNKNNLDIGILVDQMSTMRTQELEPRLPTTEENDIQIRQLKVKLQKALEERDHFQAQYKFQTQVNSELKNLLVASVGEDLQTRVNVLTEDKLQLARALLDTANNLSTHTEQIEFLAGQCEVWRSKFLASSVMVEELARWKADLTQKNQMLNESTKQLLHATHQIREIQFDMLRNLKFLAKIRYLSLPATDVISLSAENLNILQQMVLHSGVGMPDTKLSIEANNKNPLCDAERYAVQALEFISQPLMSTDDAMRALFGQAHRPYGAFNFATGHVEDSSSYTVPTAKS